MHENAGEFGPRGVNNAGVHLPERTVGGSVVAVYALNTKRCAQSLCSSWHRTGVRGWAAQSRRAVVMHARQAFETSIKVCAYFSAVAAERVFGASLHPIAEEAIDAWCS